MKRSVLTSLVFMSIAAGSALAQGDPAVIERIINEGKNNSQVWNYLEKLATEMGPRLTGSTRLHAANEWTRDEFARLGLTDAHLHQWGEIPVRFDRGPSFARIVEPIQMDLEFTTPAWSAGTDGSVRGAVIKEPTTLEEIEALGDKLQGAWILTQGRQRGGRQGVVPAGMAPEVAEEIQNRLDQAGIAGKIVANRDELVRTFSANGWRTLDPNNLPTEVTMYVRRSDYDVMNSRLADGEEVVIEAHLNNELIPGPHAVYNTVAEIRGTEKPDEVIIISAHLDSWDGPGSHGAQDNGTGSSVTLETARILMAANVRPKRTIRFILWTGEEQGLLGSRAYADGLSEEERAKVSAVFVDDGGTNFQGGLDCIEPQAEMLRRATEAVNKAFPDMQVNINVHERMPRGGGSDHASFNRIGIPGFFWEERGSGGREGKNYRFIWHTQHDTVRYAVQEYLVQSATCSAVTAYNLAMADTLLPRQEAAAEAEAEGRPRPAITATTVAEPTGNPTESTLNGAWVGKVEGDNEVEFTMTFQVYDSGDIRGTFASQIGEGPLRNIRFDRETGDLAAFYVSPIGMLRFSGKLEGNALSGSITMGREREGSRSFKAERKPKEG